ncbi:MAG: chromosomal replication initiator protein DnaA [Clostridiales bacterium]|nr:chromosomal replication initiator protein DnaA [Clostridiales bacterium]
MDIAACWAQALSLLEKAFTEVVFESMIRPLIPVSYENNTFTLKTHIDVFKTSINLRYLYDITSCLRSVLNEDVEVKILSPEDLNPSSATRKSSADYSKTNLRSKYIFETFVKGKCNELAYAAALAVSEAPGNTGYNPLFLYGGVGLGKTHLIHSIGNYAFEQYPSLKVLYVSTEAFMNEFIFAIREKCTQDFKNKYRECDLLLIDDIQFLEGKVETQEEMFHTFNTLYNDSKQVVLTSDLPPKELVTLEDRLTSRFGMGLTVDITMPDYETRAAILEKKLDVEHINIPKEVKEFITRNIVSNIRDLEGALNKVTAYARLTSTPITLELAENALKDQLVGSGKPEITLQYIQQIVSAYYGMTPADINSRKRTQNIVYPRQIAMYLSRKILDVSLPEVGEFYGGRDHSTVIHSCDKITAELESDQNLRIVVNELERRIKGE